MMIETLLVIALICACIIGIALAAIVLWIIWALAYTIYCAMTGKPHPFDNPIKKSFDIDEESK